jgi:hypothetical protein
MRDQRQWARFRGIAIDRNGYVTDPRDNLFLPLSPAFEQALIAAGGGELKAQRHLPPKLQAPHSSAVLAINVFQYWEGRMGTELPLALGCDGALASLAIERQYPTGLRGTPPTLDVVLTLADGRLLAIESKFTEWRTTQRPKLDEFQEKYLDRERALWDAVGLPACQRLAADIATGTERFRQLGALQLLKHALGLATSAPGVFSLLYLFHDDAGDSVAATVHRAELERFAARVDAALGFRVVSYQTLFARLAETPGVDRDYLDYLCGRYLEC